MTRYNVQLALDHTTLQVVANVQNVSGQIVAASTTTPIEIRDISTGSVIADSRLTVSASGFVPAFDTTVDAVNVDWWDGTNRVGLESAEGVKEDAAASATSAAASAAAATSAQLAAEAAQSAATTLAATAVKKVNGVLPDSSGNVTISTGGGGGGGAVTSVAGKTGDVSLVKADVGLALVDNTADADKPVSSLTQAALNGKANTSHTHTIADVASLQSTLDSKAGINAAVNASQVNAGTGVVDPAHLGTGTSITTKFLRGDGTWQTVSGGGGAVSSVNGQTGAVVLAASDVGALPSTYTAPVTSVAGRTGAVTLAKADVGLGSVDNTADSAKPVSTAQAAADAAVLAATVQLAGAQTVAGVKTFSSAPVVPDGSFPQAKVASLVTDLAARPTVSGGITAIQQITQAAYTALGTKVSTTLYVIVG